MLELRRPIVAVASCMRDGQDKLATTIVDDAPGCDAVGHAIGSNSPQRQAADLDEVEPSKLLRGDRHTFPRGLTTELSRAAKRRRLECIVLPLPLDWGGVMRPFPRHTMM